MHVLYIYAEITIKGGTDKVLVEKANWLVNHGYKVTIVTEAQMGRPVSFLLDSKVRHVDMGLDFNSQYSKGVIGRFFTYYSLMKKYKRLLNKTLIELHPDIVITVMGRSLSLLHSIKDGSIKIGEAHTTKNHLRNLHLMEEKGFFFRLIAIFMRRKMCLYASKLKTLVLLTQRDADDWNKSVNTCVIPNPISFYPTEPAKLKNRQVIMVGRYNDAKGYDYLIPAWEIVHNRYPDWILNVFGSGELHDQVVEWIREKHLETSMILHEPTDNIMAKYLESSICVLSSRYEGFSLVILEAMACGVPVVSFDCPHGPHNIIKDGEDGILVDYLNSVALADALCQLIAHEDLRHRLGEKARINILRFSEESIMKQWDSLFQKIVKL